ncbi:MAG TPA: NIPSNAP family protein, partial [Tepidisphaeraceae bacterium]
MLKKILIGSLVVLSGFAVLRLNAAEQRAARAAAEGERYFEMRTYHANEGKLKALNSRFRDHTNALFQKHGMDIIGFWEPV